jgi:hypothetical protein
MPCLSTPCLDGKRGREREGEKYMDGERERERESIEEGGYREGVYARV